MSQQKSTPFARLLTARKDKLCLLETYNEVLQELFRKKQWRRGEAEPLQRIPWQKAINVKQCEPFKACGLYVWGVQRGKRNIPIYLGMTANSFYKRFARYIWDEHSQCNLADRYGNRIKKNKLSGFTRAVRRGRSKVRLAGAIRFAQEGIRNIWFALLPHWRKRDVRKLERALIPIAAAWNALYGYRPLLNIQRGRRASAGA
jgi:hypothetical protein